MADKQVNSIKLFEDKLVRSVWNDEEEKWYFSVVDVVNAETSLYSSFQPTACFQLSKTLYL